MVWLHTWCHHLLGIKAIKDKTLHGTVRFLGCLVSFTSTVRLNIAIYEAANLESSLETYLLQSFMHTGCTFVNVLLYTNGPRLLGSQDTQSGVNLSLPLSISFSFSIFNYFPIFLCRSKKPSSFFPQIMKVEKNVERIKQAMFWLRRDAVCQQTHEVKNFEDDPFWLWVINGSIAPDMRHTRII